MPSRNDKSGAISKARYLRKQSTEMEQQAWLVLRAMKEQRFRRQYPIGDYVLDFYSPRYRLCIEIDGPQHDEDRDKVRDAWLEEQDIYTLRFKTEDIYGNLEALEKKVKEVCQWRKPLW